MRTTERLRKLKAWMVRELCTGRQMKTPGTSLDIAEIATKEPECYLAWAPSRLDTTVKYQTLPANVAPCIIIMPNQSYAKYTEEKRFDRYNNIHRSQEIGQHLNLSILFTVYEPGVRLRGFVDSVGEKGAGLDMSRIMEGSEQGLFTLANWMDDCMDAMLGQKIIPGTDMFLEESTMTYGLRVDQEYVTDHRPLYYGFINVSFAGFATEDANREIDRIL